MAWFRELCSILSEYQSVFAMVMSLLLLWILLDLKSAMRETRIEVANAISKSTDVIEKGLENNTRAVLVLLSEKGAALLSKFQQINGKKKEEVQSEKTFEQAERSGDTPLSDEGWEF